jgi:PAS domain S-box-containing protein
VAAYGIYRDISDRKEAEEAFLREKAFLDQLVESAPEAIALGENDGRILRVNSEFCRLFGYKEKEVLGKNIDDLISSAEKKSEAVSVTQTVGKGKKFSLETVRRGKNGKPIDVSLIGSPIIIDGQQVATYGIYRDISDRKQAEEALQESEERYRTLVENANDIVFRTDENGCFTFVNPVGLRIAGYEEGEIIGKHYSGLIHSDMRDQAIRHFGRQFIRGIQNTYLEYPLLTKDGHIIWIGQNTQLIVEDGHMTGFQAVARDISDRKQAEEEIKRQLAEKEILLKEVHHRIKNNIASIGGLLSLHVQSTTNPEAIAVLQDAIGRVNSMRILYDKLLLSEDYKDISVKNYVESLVDSVVSLFPDMAKVALDKQIDDFHLDSKRLFPLGIIINELLTNIMKYAFINRDTGLIKISLANVDNHITLTIQDNGIGLPDGFDINEPKGFGLMLVKMLSQQLGGSFSIKKHAGTRSIVEFNL